MLSVWGGGACDVNPPTPTPAFDFFFCFVFLTADDISLRYTAARHLYFAPFIPVHNKKKSF